MPRTTGCGTVQDFSYADFDTEALTAQAKEALDMVRARARATEAPEKGSYTVIISGKEMRDLMELYTMLRNDQYDLPRLFEL